MLVSFFFIFTNANLKQVLRQIIIISGNTSPKLLLRVFSILHIDLLFLRLFMNKYKVYVEILLDNVYQYIRERSKNVRKYAMFLRMSIHYEKNKKKTEKTVA